MSNPPVAPATSSQGRAESPRGGAVPAAEKDAGLRELMAVREIAKALLTANHPGEVYELALQHVSPIVGASLACVYVMDGGDTMRLAAAHNWPKKYAKFLDDMRVRMGSGPSGSAAALRKVVEVPDVFEDPALEDWREVAKELGFRSLVALPLQTATGVHGAVTFYFSGSAAMTADARGLLRVVADQMAAAAEKARLIDELRGSNAELEKQYAAVVAARRLQDEFLANVSHELRTPLTSVLGYLSLIEEGAAGPVTTEQRETLSEVKASSEKLLGLIGDLLDLTALKRSELTVTSTSFDPREALKDAINAAGARKSGVALNVENGGTIALMTSDRAKVTRLLTAIIANAFKFTEEGDVRVSMAANGDRLEFRIADTGVGISEEAREFVFDEFRQEDGSATRRFGGSGLGLALARQLARLLGGDIELSSASGKGSTFVVDLPLIYQA
ncbi:MAG TPA: GAF domain-containing sensor histidine kinase [Gemmatimonadaceae bacterium]